jgi:rhodanese-related sulfurtransferase
MLVSPADIVATAKATITECSVTEVQQCLTADTLLIDIREPGEFLQGRIPGAVHLPRGLLEFELHRLVAAHPNMPDSNCPIVLYCGTGGRSALAAQSAEAMGYTNVKSMAGGIVAWAAAKLPVES